MQAPRISRYPNREPPEVKERIVEVGVFLFLIVPSMLLAYFTNQETTLGFVFVATSTILRDLALVSLILFFLWRDHEPMSDIGWSFQHVWREIGIGIVLFVPTFVFASILQPLLARIGLTSPPSSATSFLQPTNLPQVALALALVLVVALAEETIFRGYLIQRFRTMTLSTAMAVALSSVIFALGHGYEGGVGLVTVGIIGVIFALVYIWRGSLVAPMTMHFLQDFIGIVLIPLLHIL